MRCREATRKGEELLRIPLSVCWTVEAAKACPELAPLGEELLGAISDESLLALHILATRSKGEAAEGVRREHLQVLQHAEFETLMEWSADDLKTLEGSKWATVPQQQREDFILEFSELQEVAGDVLAELGVDLEAFLWAHRLLMSRAVHFSMEDGSTLMVLAPGQDMFNHSLDAPVGDDDLNLVRTDDGRRCLVIRAYRDFQVGEEAVYSYRGASNGRLLMLGGFVLPGNPFDVVELQFQLPACSSGALPLFKSLAEGLDTGIRALGSVAPEAKNQFMEVLEDGSIALHVQLRGEDVGAQLERVLAFFRLVRLCRNGAVPSAEELVDSDADKPTRVAVLIQLHEHLRQMLALYPTTLEQDEAALRAAEAVVSATTAERRRGSALRVLAGEKHIYARAIAWLESRIDALTVKPARSSK